MPTNRNKPHRSTLKAGTISFGGGGIGCDVENLSVIGASLGVGSSDGIPSSFYLTVGEDNLTRACRVTWSSATRLDVAFF